MRVVLDVQRCQSNALCMMAAPSVFAVDEQGEVTILDAEPGDDVLPAVERAVKLCPTQALRLTPA